MVDPEPEDASIQQTPEDTEPPRNSQNEAFVGRKHVESVPQIERVDPVPPQRMVGRQADVVRIHIGKRTTADDGFRRCCVAAVDVASLIYCSLYTC